MFPIHIRDHGRALLLDYEAFLDYHAGHARAGAAIAWRAMECAAMLLSEEQPWDRDELTVSARHPGPGVRDALEYVTRCFTRGAFTHDAAGKGGAGPCASPADFRFTVSDGRRVVQLQLLDDAVPASFFVAVRQARDNPDSGPAQDELDTQKALAAELVEHRELDQLFQVDVTDLSAGMGAAHA